MRLSNRIADILILMAAFSLLGALFTKIFHIWIVALVPQSYFNFADTCLLLGIAIYLSDIFRKYKA